MGHIEASEAEQARSEAEQARHDEDTHGVTS
jgi:hypothetical protein